MPGKAVIFHQIKSHETRGKGRERLLLLITFSFFSLPAILRIHIHSTFETVHTVKFRGKNRGLIESQSNMFPVGIISIWVRNW